MGEKMKGRTLKAALGLMGALLFGSVLACGPTYVYQQPHPYQEEGYYYMTEGVVDCPPGSYWDGEYCMATESGAMVTCPDGTVFINGKCVPHQQVKKQCPAGSWYDGQACVSRDTDCPPNTYWDGRNCITREVRCPDNTIWNGKRCIKPGRRGLHL